VRRSLVVILAVAFVVSTAGAQGCGTSSESDQSGGAAPKSEKGAKKRAAKRRAEARAERKARARSQAQAQARAKASARARARARAKQRQEAAPPAAPEPNCDPNYSGCLDPNASDYDCAGGSGDGPKYTGTVTVLGDDHYDLNRDDDNIACDP
jgi:hypothetical protein